MNITIYGWNTRKSIDPAGDVKEMAQQWSRADERNRALRDVISDRYAREVFINSANRDLVLAAMAGCAVTVDPLHMQVVSQRFQDEDEWGLRGYSVPVLFPRLANCRGRTSRACAATGI